MTAPIAQKSSKDLLGGMLNNLPGDVMQRMCKGRVIAVDVSSKKDIAMPGSMVPSPWAVIRSRILPRKVSSPMPTIFDVLTRSTLLASVSKTDEVKASVDLYLNPPVDKFGLLEFSALQDIADIGYQYAKEEVRSWRKTQQHKG